MKRTKISLRSIGIMRPIITLMILFLASPQIVFSQTKPILDNFYAYLIEDQVYLRWVISSGSTCDGTKIYRSTDSLNFYQIGDIQGICGSTSSPQTYDFYDTVPVKNSRNFYRLELGSLGYSEVVSVDYIALEGDAYQLRPNPASTESKLHFNNPHHESHQLSLYSLEGKLLDVFTTDEQVFTLNVQNLSSGIYVFALEALKTNQISAGKILVCHP